VVKVDTLLLCSKSKFLVSFHGMWTKLPHALQIAKTLAYLEDCCLIFEHSFLVTWPDKKFAQWGIGRVVNTSLNGWAHVFIFRYPHTLSPQLFFTLCPRKCVNYTRLNLANSKLCGTYDLLNLISIKLHFCFSKLEIVFVLQKYIAYNIKYALHVCVPHTQLCLSVFSMTAVVETCFEANGNSCILILQSFLVNVGHTLFIASSRTCNSCNTGMRACT